MDRNELAKTHAKNKAQLRKALNQQKLILNNAIKTGNKLQEHLCLRIYIFLYLALLETSLNFLLYYYHKQINIRDLNSILTEGSQEKKWNKLIDLAFRNNYLAGKTSKNLDLVDLGLTNHSRYLYIKKLLETEITSFIGIRNKLAHGQWAIALNNEGTDKIQETTTKLWTLSKKDCLHVKNIVENYLKITECLIASKDNLNKVYDSYVHKIEFTKHTHAVSYEWIITDMKRRYKAFDRKVIKK